MGRSNNTGKIGNGLIRVIILSSIGAFILFLIYKNIKYSCTFWNASAIDIATLAVAVVISYYLVEKENNQRKQKEILFSLIEKLQLQVEDKKAYNFNDLAKEEITMNNRDISNKIRILEESGAKCINPNDIQFIREKFHEYENFIGGHIEDMDYLRKSQKDLKRPLDLIASKLIKISIDMYK